MELLPVPALKAAPRIVISWQELRDGEKPLLISHSPTHKHEGRQHGLAEALATRYRDDWHFPHWPVDISKVRVSERERTQRTRGFLYSSIGAAVAAGFGIDKVVVADNGWVSVGLPVSGQAVGTKMSRTTHPRFQYRFNELLSLVLPGVQIRNPLLFQTRSEALDLLKREGVASLLTRTHSCAAERRAPNSHAHCGVCSQCVDRRIAVVAAGLGMHDTLYDEDVFLGDLTGTPLMLAEAYVRLMRRLLEMSDDQLARHFVEVADCSTREGTGGEPQVQQICQMLIRQAGTINDVLAEVARPVMNDIIAGKYSANCMVRLAIAGKPAAKTRRSSAVELEKTCLPEVDQAELDQYALRCRTSIRFSAERARRSSTCVYVNGSKLPLTEAEFVFLLRLGVELVRSPDGWCRKGDGKRGGGLVDEGTVPADVDKAVARLRVALQSVLGEVSPTDLVEVYRGRVRLSTHRTFIAFDREGLLRHQSERVRQVMSLAPMIPVA